MPITLLSDTRRAELLAAPLTYPDVGRSLALPHPAGYRSQHRSLRLPATIDFDTACGDLFDWQLQLRAGVRVAASAKVIKPDVVADLILGIGPLAVKAPVRMVTVVDEPTRKGFAYGTLPGHPEAGEEAFWLDLGADGATTLSIAAFSKSGNLLSRISGPIGHRVQNVITNRYLKRFAPS